MIASLRDGRQEEEQEEEQEQNQKRNKNKNQRRNINKAQRKHRREEMRLSHHEPPTSLTRPHCSSGQVAVAPRWPLMLTIKVIHDSKIEANITVDGYLCASVMSCKS